jgi:hypothetical protein
MESDRGDVVGETVRLCGVVTKPTTFDPVVQMADANRRGFDIMVAAQALFVEEMVFVVNEMLDRTRTETHLFAEFISKLAGSHSVNDWGAMCRECGQHQIDFIRRDCERFFRHGEGIIEKTSSLIAARSRNGLVFEVDTDPRIRSI